MPVATTTTTVEGIKQAIGSLNLTANDASPASTVDLREYAHFDCTPATGTEFRAYTSPSSTTPVLSIRDVLADEAKLRSLARLV
jgi:hypothetical protein